MPIFMEIYATVEKNNVYCFNTIFIIPNSEIIKNRR